MNLHCIMYLPVLLVLAFPVVGCGGNKSDSNNNSNDASINNNDVGDTDEQNDVSDGDVRDEDIDYDDTGDNDIDLADDADDTDNDNDSGIDDDGGSLNCQDDNDCLNTPETPICNEYTDFCVQCYKHSHCDAGQICQEDFKCHPSPDDDDAGDDDLDGGDTNIPDAEGCLSSTTGAPDGWCDSRFGEEAGICYYPTKKCVECVCNTQCRRGYGCEKFKCIEGGDGGVHIDCHTGEEIEEEVEIVGTCPKEPREYVEPSPECPGYARLIPEGWSTLGRIQPPPENVPPKDWDAYMYPPINVYISSFCMQIDEVTIGDYKACVDAGVCSEPYTFTSRWRDHYYDWSVYDDFPVINLTYPQAEAYCKWIGGQLPTEAEFEKAARGPEKNWWPWGDFFPDEDLCEYANIQNYTYRGCNNDTCPVGLYPKGRSDYGINDLMSNISEMTIDAQRPGFLTDELEGAKDPVVVEEIDDIEHSLKGGNFNSFDGTLLRVEQNYDWHEVDYSNIAGFRCLTWSAATPTVISYKKNSCEKAIPPPEEFPEPSGFRIDNLPNVCAKWGNDIIFRWDYFWDYGYDCGGFQLAWREENSTEWEYHNWILSYGVYLQIQGSGIKKYYIRVRPYWGRENDVRICSDSYAELTLILTDDPSSPLCPSLEPFTIGHITDPDPANATYQCF